MAAGVRLGEDRHRFVGRLGTGPERQLLQHIPAHEQGQPRDDLRDQQLGCDGSHEQHLPAVLLSTRLGARPGAGWWLGLDPPDRLVPEQLSPRRFPGVARPRWLQVGFGLRRRRVRPHLVRGPARGRADAVEVPQERRWRHLVVGRRGRPAVSLCRGDPDLRRGAERAEQRRRRGAVLEHDPRPRAQGDRCSDPNRTARLRHRRRGDGQALGARSDLHGAGLGVRVRGEALVRPGAAGLGGAMRRAIYYGLATALAAGCGPTSPRLETPAPQDEVSVGYGTQSRHAITGAVTSVSPTEAETRVPRIEQLLQARVPGLEVLPLRDGTYTLRIRGAHGLRGSISEHEPLLVVDDIPTLPGALGPVLASLAPRY